MGPNQFCSICFEGEIAFLISQSPSQLSGTQRLVPIYSLLWNQKPAICIFLSKPNNVWLPGVSFSVCMQRQTHKEHKNPFHLTPHCEHWHWWNPLWPCQECACTTTLSQGWVSHLLCDLFTSSFARCREEDGGPGGGKLSAPSFHGSSFLGGWFSSHLAHAMDSKWDFKSSHLFTASTPVTLPAWKASLGSWDYLSTSSWPLAGGGWDAGWHPADRSAANGPFRCWYWLVCCRLPLRTRKTRPWNETILLI